MPNSLRIIVHPHCGINDGKMRCIEGRKNAPGRPRGWAKAHPLAEDILLRYSLRDRVYRAEARTARARGIPIILMDHKFYPKCINDDASHLMYNSSPPIPRAMALRLSHEICRMKGDLVEWFGEEFGEENIFRGKITAIGGHLFDRAPRSTKIRIIGEFLHCCVHDVFNSLLRSGYLFSRIIRDKCVE